MAVDSYQGVHGTIEIDASPVAASEFDVKVSRGTATAKRANKWSDLCKPGKVSITGSIKSIMVDGSLLGMIFSGTPTTGQNLTLHAGLTYPAGASSENITDMTSTTLTSASLIKFTAKDAAITGAGQAIIYGTDAAGNKISEVVEIPTLGINASVTSSRAFKTVTHVVLLALVGAGGTLEVAGIAGNSTVSVAAPKMFTLVGKLTNGSNHVYINLPNCFLTEGSFAFGDADEISMNNCSFAVQDCDLATVESV
jgi:hypothetical protein